MIPTLQKTSTNFEANVFRFDVFVASWACIQRTVPLLSRLPLAGLLLARATPLPAFMSPTVQSRSANSTAGRRFFQTLMAHCIRCRPSTATRDLGFLKTRPAFPIMADLFTGMAASKKLVASFFAVRNRHSTVYSRLWQQLGE